MIKFILVDVKNIHSDAKINKKSVTFAQKVLKD